MMPRWRSQVTTAVRSGSTSVLRSMGMRSTGHGKDGKPVKKGARDMRDPNNICRWSDGFWFWRISEGVPKTKMKSWKSMLSEEQIWHVMAFENQFSNDGKPHDHSCYKPGN